MEVNCEFAGDKMIETHNIEYNDLDLSAMKSAYTETGGTAPEFTYRDNIDDVQKQLQAVGYKCKKIK